ncbi:hypothetical protein [Pseudomonas sp. PSB1]|uniref:hypothetical protein n=1 Tax=Pseudomonas sp. PSB1 TaxID=477819 RepID=UPI001660534A|nr:hypothetical protein [Pseudomonas sp. PSB1]MBD0701865.1 hypothetical protein [Pseudomonas sp. PSB1]
MSSKQASIIGLVWGLASAGALAELPDQSILTRYGVTSEQLPAAQAGAPVEATSPRPRFDVQAEKPWVSVSLGEVNKPATTGNISIDHAIEQEYNRCLRLRDQMMRRKGGLISCQEGSPTPGMDIGFSR